MTKLIQKLLERWTEEGVEMYSPGEEELVRHILNQTEKPYSDDLVKLYTLTGGMLTHQMDQHLFRLWPLEDLPKENHQLDDQRLWFADWSMMAHTFCVVPKNTKHSTVSAIHSPDGEPIQIANTLRDFFKAYLESPQGLIFTD